jgi:NAD(P)-dependent dehydrogenase (short-subunit alcohol dehydrogenase family)
MPNPNTWCPPIHHNPEGPTDPSKASLPDPFVVVILGASRGIGAGVASCFIKAGASGLVICGRNMETLKQRKVELEKLGGKAKIEPIKCDVTVDAEVAQTAQEVKKLFGRLDVLIINAGIAAKLVKQPNGLLDWPSNLVDADIADFRRVMELNTLAPWVACHYFLPLLEASTGGPQSIIYVSSAASHYTDPKMMSSTYSLSKFAGNRLIEHVHESHKDKGVCAFAIQPGGVKTEMAEVPEGKGWEESKDIDRSSTSNKS